MAEYVVCKCGERTLNPHPPNCPKCGAELLVSAGAPLAEVASETETAANPVPARAQPKRAPARAAAKKPARTAAQKLARVVAQKTTRKK